MKKLTTDEWVKKAREVHGDKYDYALVEYVGPRAKIKILCPEHGVFEQLPIQHVWFGLGCPECAAELKELKRRSATEKFLTRVRRAHGTRYFEYKSSETIADIPTYTECKNRNPCHEKGYLYVMVDSKEIPTMMKIGCSIHPHNRCKDIIYSAKREGKDISTLCVAKVWEGNTKDIYRFEHELHSRFSDRLYFGKDRVFDGSTEFFHYDGSVFDSIDELFL